MASQDSRAATWLRLATLALLWGSGFLLIKVALRGFSPYQIVLARLALGGLVLLVFVYAGRDSLPRGRIVWLHLAVAAVLANIAPYLLFAIAERWIDSATAGMINATTPLLTVIVAVLLRHEPRPPLIRVLGLLVGVGGTAILLTPWVSGSQYTSWGVVAALLASLCYAISYVYMDRFLVSRELSPLSLAAAQLLAASAITLFAFPAAHGWHPPIWRFDATLSLVILGVTGTGFAYVLNYRIIADDGASAASVVTYLLPITALVLGAFILEEMPTVHAIIGLVIVLAGVALARHRVARPQREPIEPGARQ
jgi:drug/metabolite transporter (DMT)-like permease